MQQHLHQFPVKRGVVINESKYSNSAYKWFSQGTDGWGLIFLQESHTYTCTCMDHTAVDDVLDVWGELVTIPSSQGWAFSVLLLSGVG